MSSGLTFNCLATVGQELWRRDYACSQRPSGKTKMAKLDGKSQPVMIPPVLADYLEVLVG